MMEERRVYKNYDEISDVKVISYSQPSQEFLHLMDEEGKNTLNNLISYCARVSNPSNQNNTETANKLIDYCIKNKHWSIFEMATVCVEITTTRDISRQILRHKNFFQEYSQRYADPTKDLEFCLRECRLQDPKNRQKSIPTDDIELSDEWKKIQLEVIEFVRERYDWAINNGIAKEVARVILPEGNTVSKMYMNATLRSFIHYIEVRDGNGTQKEHMTIARACAEAINKIFPYIK
jgi:thymidylate synthase (FAD)